MLTTEVKPFAGGGGGSIGDPLAVVHTADPLIPHPREVHPVQTVLVAYIVVPGNPLMVSHASHFIDSYRAHHPGCDHQLLIVVNGGKIAPKLRPIFDAVPHDLLMRENDPGWDVSAYIEVSRKYPSDLQVCLGESVYFTRHGWLERTVGCVNDHGPGMYGFFSSNLVRPHLNTTAFAASPHYLSQYQPPVDRAGRYTFEHGHQSLWRRIQATGAATRLVTWDGCWLPHEWRSPKNIMWRGTQENCLMACNHVQKYFAATDAMKQTWARGADTGYR